MRRSLLTRNLSVVAEDLFTDTDAVTVGNHVPVGFIPGQSWTKYTSGGANSGDATIQSNRAMNTNDTAIHNYYHSWVPSNPDYRVEADAVCLTDNNLSIVGVTGRIVTNANTYYILWWLASTNLLQVFKFVAGTPTQLGGSVTQAPATGVTYRLGIGFNGQRITGYLDGNPIINTFDGAIPGPGRAGIHIQAAATSSTGFHLDNWRVSQ